MSTRTYLVAILAAVLLAAVPAGASAQDDEVAVDGEATDSDPAVSGSTPYGVCIDGVCRVTDEPFDVDAEAPDSGSAVAFTADGDVAGRIVCPEGDGECIVNDASSSIDDLAKAAKGRLVYGAVDTDPSGPWRTTSLPTRVRCTIAGAGKQSLKLKQTKARSTIERQLDGNLIGQSRRAGEPPFLMVRLGPGLYGSVQHFSENNVTGVVVSYYGLLAEDRIEGTAVMTSTLRDGGPRTDCTMKRNFDMKRTSGPTASPESPAADGTATPSPAPEIDSTG